MLDDTSNLFKSGLETLRQTIGKRIQALLKRRKRIIRLCETLPLGERRFLAVVMVEDQRFLVGGTGNSIALLARLGCIPEPAGSPIALPGETCDT